MKTSRILKLAMVGCAVAAMAACTRKPPVETGVPGPNDGTSTAPTGPAYPTAPTGPVTGGGLGSAQPGSEQDFVVNVGDRVFFESDQTDLTSTARATLDKQARWLQGYDVQIAQVLRTYGDGRLSRPWQLPA